MTVRFQADADLNAEIVAGVLRREPSIDFQMADEANLHRVPDPEYWRSLLKRAEFWSRTTVVQCPGTLLISSSSTAVREFLSSLRL